MVSNLSHIKDSPKDTKIYKKNLTFFWEKFLKSIPSYFQKFTGKFSLTYIYIFIFIIVVL